MQEKILKVLNHVAAEQGVQLDLSQGGETILLSSGLDSLGFAIVVASIEEQYGVDPFIQMEDPIYPKTLGEFFAFYEKHWTKT